MIRQFYLAFISILLISCNKDVVNKGVTGWNDELILDKRYDSVCFLMTHNAFNCPPHHEFPNQDTVLTQQMRDGVRGLMIDVYDGSGGPVVYHATPILGSEPLRNNLQEIRNFLDSHPHAIISIIFENHCTNTALQDAIISLGLDTLAYIHDGSWPTIQQMIDSHQRLVMFVENSFPAQPREPWLHHAWSIVFDTPYTYHSTDEFSSDINRGGSGTKELYLVNHWLSNGLGLPDKSLAPEANRHDILSKRLRDCQTAQNHFINYLGVDFYDIGSCRMLADSINGF